MGSVVGITCWEGGGLLSWVTVIGGGGVVEVVTCSSFSEAVGGAPLFVFVGTLRSDAGLMLLFGRSVPLFLVSACGGMTDGWKGIDLCLEVEEGVVTLEAGGLLC